MAGLTNKHGIKHMRRYKIFSYPDPIGFGVWRCWGNGDGARFEDLDPNEDGYYAHFTPHGIGKGQRDSGGDNYCSGFGGGAALGAYTLTGDADSRGYVGSEIRF